MSDAASALTSGMYAARLNCGCGPHPVAGWINADIRPARGVDICCDICAGLPLSDRSIDYAVAMHLLQDLSWPDISSALQELQRVLAHDGVLRLGVPDLDRAIAAYQRNDRDYFYVPDCDARSLGGKLITQIIWYGSVRTPFTFDFAAELLAKAGFRSVNRCSYKETRSRFSEIVAMDNRERESLFVEAVK